MDKGYDSENIHQLIRDDLHAHSVIPIRSWNNEIIHGKYRREMACQFDSTRYPRRQIVETRFSVLKRKFSGDLKARIFLVQMKEIAVKMIVCNIHRHLQFFILKVFYRAKNSLKSIYDKTKIGEMMFVNGIGRTKFGVLSKSIVELAYEAMLNAINDSPVHIKDIDAIYVSNFLGGPINGQLHLNSIIASLLPSINIPIIRIESACASGSVAFSQAQNSLTKKNNIMVIGVEKMTGKSLMPPIDAIAMAGDHQIDYKNGLIFPAAYALIAQQYMYKYGISHDLLEKVSLINHQNANRNPLAHFFEKKVTLEMIKKSREISSPLNLFDCSPISDGATATIISNKKYSDRDIQILSSCITTDSISLTQRVDLTSFLSTKIAAAQVYKEARISPKNVDVVEVHDCFTISELLALEDLGFCCPGESYKMIDNGDILIDGLLPVNPDGGLIGNGHPIGATGLGQIYEIVMQLRLEAGSRQIADPEIGLAQNIGGIGGTCGITLLGR